jgi:hypothetical protein
VEEEGKAELHDSRKLFMPVSALLKKKSQLHYN